MLVCRIFIVPAGPSPRDKTAVEAKLNSLKLEFKEFSPSVVLVNNYVERYRVNPDAISMFENHLNLRGEKFDLLVEENCSPKEIAAARYVPLVIGGDHADEDRKWESAECLSAPPLPDPMDSQARHQMDSPNYEIALRSVVLLPLSGGEGESFRALRKFGLAANGHNV